MTKIVPQYYLSDLKSNLTLYRIPYYVFLYLFITNKYHGFLRSSDVLFYTSNSFMTISPSFLKLSFEMRSNRLSENKLRGKL